MAKVDQKGRIVLPKEVRERLGIEPGTEVEIHVSGNTVVVEPETDPEQVIERMEDLIEDAAANRTDDSDDEFDVHARDHAETIRRQARKADRDDE